MSRITVLIADASEVDTLKSALAEAKKDAEEERAARLKRLKGVRSPTRA